MPQSAVMALFLSIIIAEGKTAHGSLVAEIVLLDLHEFCFFISPNLLSIGYKAVGKLLQLDESTLMLIL